MPILGEGNGNQFQYSYLENPMDRGAWWAAVYRVAWSRTRLKRLSMHALEKEMATHSSILPCRIPWTEEPDGLLSMGSHRVRHDWSNLAVAAADSILKSRNITLPTMVRLVKAMVFPVVMDVCKSWTIKKAECRRIDAFKLGCWRRLLRVPCTARRSNQSITLNIHWKDWLW